MMATINVAVLTYHGVEIIDMNGPLDVFVKANRYNGNRYNVYTVAETHDIESERSAVRIMPEYMLDDCPRPDIVVIPGQVMPEGSPQQFGSGSPELRAWITEQAERPETIIMSVCIGVYILAKTGLLANKNATTHWKALESVQKEYPDIRFIKNVRFVQDGNIVTTGGVTSGIDGGLHLIELFDGAAIAREVADIMVYNRDAPLPPDTIIK